MKVNEMKMNRTKGRAVAALLTAAGLSLLAAGPAGADFYEFTFAGEVGWLQGDVPAPWNKVALGSHVEISYIFDSEAEDMDDNPNSGYYDIISAEIVVDGVAQATLIGKIWVNMDNQSYFAHFDDLPIGGVANVDLVAYPGTLETDELPLTLDLNDFPYRMFDIGDKQFPAEWKFAGIVDTFSVEIVPAPASLFVLCVGLATCTGRSRRV